MPRWGKQTSLDRQAPPNLSYFQRTFCTKLHEIFSKYIALPIRVTNKAKSRELVL